MNTTDTERRYFVFRIDARWTYLANTPGVPDRARNGCGFYHMPKEAKDQDDARRQTETHAKDWWERMDRKGTDPQDVTLKVEFVHEETWCPCWFGHWTFDVGQSDQEAVRSFSRYVFRIESQFDRDSPEFGSLLMGAEDRDRWHGRTGHGEQDAKITDPPCRCLSCKERGVIRIGH